MPARRLFAILWCLAALALMLWSWASWQGPFRWAAEWQVRQFGSYNEKLTLFVPLILLMLPAGFIGGWGPLVPPPATHAARLASARRSVKVTAILGAVALLLGAVAGGLGYRRMQTPPMQATLVLTTGTEPAPDTDLVTVTGIARTDMIVVFEETRGTQKQRWSFVPLTAPAWRAGDPVRFVLRTNQTAWTPPEGVRVGETPRLLRGGSPPFQLTTQPSVLKRYALPGLVRSSYEEARVVLDPDLLVIEQSPDEVYAPYWMAAAGGAILGVSLLLGSVIIGAAARRMAREHPSPRDLDR